MNAVIEMISRAPSVIPMIASDIRSHVFPESVLLFEEPWYRSWTPKITSTSVLELDLDIRFGTEYLVKFTLLD